MKLLISILMMGHLMTCMRHPVGREDSGKTLYRPLPRVEVSMFTARDRIVSVYVRHSRDAVLFRLSPGILGYPCAVPACGLKSVVTLTSPPDIHFER